MKDEYLEVRKSKPLTIKIAVFLLFSWVIVSVPGSLLSRYMLGVDITMIGILLSVGPALICCAFPILIQRGFNAARIVYLIFMLFILILLINSGIDDLITGIATVDAYNIFIICLNSIAVIVLFLPASNRWFRQLREARRKGR